MRAIVSVAKTAFLESIRNRTLLGILVLAMAFICSALLLAAVSLDQRQRVILDWGLFCVSLFGVILAIVMGVTQVEKEVKRKNLYVVLSRPIQRWQYVVGKYLGLTFTLMVQFLALAIALVLLLVIEGLSLSPLLVKALYLILLEIILVAAIAGFFASFSSPYLSGFFTLGVFVVGRSLDVLDRLADKLGGFLHGVLKALVYGLPSLNDFNLGNRVVYQLPISMEHILWSSLYCLGYLMVLVVLSSWIFAKRDLT